MDILDQNLESSNEGDVQEYVDSKDILTQGLTIVEDASLESGSEDHGTNVAHLTTQQILSTGVDDDVQYAFRTGDNATVTYRVVQVDDGIDPLSQIVTTSNFPTGSLSQVVTSPLNGHLYVLGNSPDVFTSAPRNIAPRSFAHVNNTTVNTHIKKRDDRRRATHNEVERRRRDKINNWIMKLSKIIPDIGSDISKGTGSFEGQSKGGILAKACEYIGQLREVNKNLSECLRENEQVTMNMEAVRSENEILKKENELLRQRLQANGISVSKGEPVIS